MALIRTNKMSSAIGVILAGGDVHTNLTGAYDGISDIVLLASMANMNGTQQAPHTYTSAEVLASTSSNPLFTYTSGNQNLSVYYDNGNILAVTSNCPSIMVAYKGNWS